MSAGLRRIGSDVPNDGPHWPHSESGLSFVALVPISMAQMNNVGDTES